MKPSVKAFFDEATNTVSYVVAEAETRACAIIDSVLDYDCETAPNHDPISFARHLLGTCCFRARNSAFLAGSPSAPIVTAVERRNIERI